MSATDSGLHRMDSVQVTQKSRLDLGSPNCRSPKKVIQESAFGKYQEQLQEYIEKAMSKLHKWT